jgi:hypothetical protein
LSIGLTVEGVPHQRLIHRLVYEAFNGTIPDGKQINHINGDKTDNRFENLEIVTAQENMRLMRQMRGAYNAGELHPHSKLTADIVLEIRRARDAGASLNSIAERHGISFQNVSDIARRKSWKHVA